jgi:hypothetical protein
MSLGVLLLLDAGVGFLDQPHTRGTAKCRTRFRPKRLSFRDVIRPACPAVQWSALGVHHGMHGRCYNLCVYVCRATILGRQIL